MVHQRIGGQVKDIYTFKFWKHKYGPELLVDIVDYAVMLPPIRRHLATWIVFKRGITGLAIVWNYRSSSANGKDGLDFIR